MSVNWATVETAAVTAGVVTMLVEYAAKPRLEARKERILAAHRHRRDLLHLIADLTQSAIFLSEEIPAGADPQLQDRFRAERQRQTERLQAKTIELFDNVNTRYSASYVGPIRNRVIAYASCVFGVVISPRSRHRKAEIIGGLGEAILGILSPQWWRPDRLHDARTRLAELIADAETPPTAAAEQVKR
jgi:hypothetical protein